MCYCVFDYTEIDEKGWTEICWINEYENTGRSHIDSVEIKYINNLSDARIVDIINSLIPEEKNSFFRKYKNIIEEHLIKTDF